MKPTDLFVRGRQFFGFLLPGAVWLLSGALLIVPKRPDFIIAVSPTWVAVTVYLVSSYLLGYATASFSYRVTRFIGSHLPKSHAQKSREEVANSLGKSVLQVFAELEGTTDALAQCKRLLRLRHKEVADHLDQYEEEINLLGMLAPALFFFGIVWLIKWMPIGDQFFRYGVSISALAICMALYFAVRLPTLHSLERIEYFKVTLASESQFVKEQNKT